MLRFDQFQLKASHRTPEGYLLCSGASARAGVLPYVDDDGTIRRELVTEEELQRTDSIGSIALKPVTDGHPQEGTVDARNARSLQRGVSLQNVQYAGGYVNIELLITDGDLADEIERGDKRELSLGYRLEGLEESPGVHPEHGEYDAIQRGRICNHVAVVERGRAGSSVAVRVDSGEQVYTYLDNQSKEDTTMDKENKAEKVTLSDALAEATSQLRDVATQIAEARADSADEESVDSADEESEALEKVMEAMAGFVEQMDGIKAKADEFQSQYDEQSAQLDALLENFRQPNEDEMDEEHEEKRGDSVDEAPASVDPERQRLDWYNERRELEAAAKRYDGIGDCSDLTNAEFRGAIVKAHFGDDRTDGASDAEIRGLFLAAEEIAKARKDSYESVSRSVTRSRQDSARGGEATAADRYRQRLMSGYREDSSNTDKIAKKIATALTSE